MLKRVLSVLLVAFSMLLAGCASPRDPSRIEGRDLSGLSDQDLRRFTQSRVFFGHQSVGSNIIDGVGLLYREVEVAEPKVGPVSDIGVEGGFLAHEQVGVNGDPQSKIDQFTSELEAGLADQVDTVVLKFCYDDITRDTDVRAIFDAYSSAMARIQREYPQLRIVYTTVPLTTKPSWKSKLKAFVTRTTPPSTADNIVREQYNDLIRTEYQGTGQLFDIASLESTAGDGSRVSGTLGDNQYFMLDSQLALDYGHLNDTGSKLAAQEFVRVVVQ